jgi:hypothetical protein
MAEWQALGSTGYYVILLAPYESTATAFRKEPMAEYMESSSQTVGID